MFAAGKLGLLYISSQTNAEQLLCDVRARLPHCGAVIRRLPWCMEGLSVRAALGLAQSRSILLVEALSGGSCTLTGALFFLVLEHSLQTCTAVLKSWRQLLLQFALCMALVIPAIT